MVGIELFGSYWMAQNRRSRLAFVLLVVLKFKGVLRNPDPESEVSGQRSEESHDFAEEPPVLESASARVKIARKISLQDCVQAILIFGQGVLMVLLGVHFRRGGFFSRIGD